MRIAITHSGSAHRDEFIALCLLIASGKIDSVMRRDPSAAELEDSDVYVVDVGMQHNPDKLNFDHHHFDRGASPVCAITLVLDHLGISTLPDSYVRRVWGWLSFSEMIDSKGPFQTASHLGVNPDVLLQSMSPIESVVLRWFESVNTVSDVRGDELWNLMMLIGKTILGHFNAVMERVNFLYENAKIHHIGDLTVVDATAVGRSDNPVLGLEIFCEEISSQLGEKSLPAVGVTVTQDDRGDGLSLFRRKDNPMVDFSKLEGKVRFAHKGGFVAKTYPDQDWVTLIKASLKWSFIEE